MQLSLCTHVNTRAMFFGTILCLVLAPLVHGQDQKREQIGEVLGKPVFRDDIRDAKDFPLKDELHRLFTVPVMQKYRRAHRAEIKPTDEEILEVTAYFDKQHRQRIRKKEPELRKQLKEVEEQLARRGLANEKQQKLEVEKLVLQTQLKPPGRFFAVFMLNNWKFQRHLYDRYGGGRILWQQAGVEAFDAMRTWLEAHEQNGDFKITDPALRTSFYKYWTTMDHGSFLTDDKERIRAGLLEPEWAPRRPPEE